MNVLLQDIFNFDEFMKKFTEEEQQKLMKLLPGVDSVDLPDRFITQCNFQCLQIFFSCYLEFLYFFFSFYQPEKHV